MKTITMLLIYRGGTFHCTVAHGREEGINRRYASFCLQVAKGNGILSIRHIL